MAKDKTFTAAIEPNYPPTVSAAEAKSFTVIFKENRPFELVINMKLYRWEPYASKELTSSEVASDDFQSSLQYFTVIPRG